MAPSPPDSRNLIDPLKGRSVEEIRQILEASRHPFGVLILNVAFELNISTIIRTCNIFGAKEIFYLGRRKYNRKGCVGTYIYENVTHLATLEEAKRKISLDYTWVGIDNSPNAVPLPEFIWPPKPLLIFGHERDGLDSIPDLSYNCSSTVSIPQQGSCRSLNVSVAAGIAIYDLALKKGWLK